MQFGLLPERPEFKAYVARLAERPALRRANARESEIAARRKP
jgi:glutathione S-transferase